MKEDLKYKGVDFSDIESDREFYGCTFEECSFAQAKLTNVLFSRCEFIRCDFSLCKIYGVSFQDVRFVGVRCWGAILPGVRDCSLCLILRNVCCSFFVYRYEVEVM